MGRCENKKTIKGPLQSTKNRLTVEVVSVIKETKKAKSEPRIPQHNLTEENDFVEMEVITPKLNDTERRKVIPEGNNNQKNPFAETHNETGIV